MIFPLKLQHTPESKVFFWSDLHYHHNPNWDIPLWRSRGFDSVFAHDASIVENWNGKVSNNDTVVLLGDSVLGAGKQSKEVFENLLKILDYKALYIMAGNHAAGYKQIFQQAMEAETIDQYYRLLYHPTPEKNVYFIPNYYEIFVGNDPLVLSHYAILSWNGMSKGSKMLFGHSHAALSKTPWAKDNYLTGKCLDICVDSFPAPLSYDEICEIMDKKPILRVDHHDGDTSTPFSRKN